MTPTELIGLTEAALVLILTVAGPLLLTSLIVGVFVGLLQALTQIQETTLTFVPKLVAMGLVFLLMLPTIGQALGQFMGKISDMIIHG
ncbi:flagellar biosynthetic protein FliQ [Sphingomonas sp. HT-1]|uniref:flagellar biosynthetic protein FliQ n=1 Tax=unclassified Sphingomonas TaxID=196159 RepID=UPI000314DF9A|nr:MULTISPECIES: flagellar biosynthetic protein FliQ [unclassified Sphingomonas]KTF70609.1 flagellar biosynthetic protein FliQ [Sphingomonas sp. WG]